MSELNGQMYMFGAEAEAPQAVTEGYDRDGNLLDVPEVTHAVIDEESDKAMVIAAEINAIKLQVRRSTLAAAVEIGKKLLEARALIPHGRWLSWLKVNVNYSDRTAQNLIAVYEEYSKNPNPQALADLSYSQAVALLGLPQEQRAALIDSGEAAEMSTRELEAEVKRLREADAERQLTMAQLEAKAATAAEEIEAAKRAIESEHEAVRLAQARADAAEATAEALRGEKTAAKESAEVSAQRAADAVKRANDTQNRLAHAEAELAELKAKEPEVVEVIPDSVTAEIDSLKAQLAKAQGAAANADSKTLALALHVRIAVADAKAKAEDADRALAVLQGLAPEKADMLRKEFRALADWIIKHAEEAEA